MTDTVFFILQVRTSSTRLPGKMLMPFHEDKTIPEIIIERLMNNGISSKNIIVATTNNPKDDGLASLLAKKKCNIFRGEEYNVLKRFIDAASLFNAKYFFRVCADNPFLNFEYIAEIIDKVEYQKTDYSSFYLDNTTPTIKTHFGFFCEYTSLKTLKRVASLTKSAKDIEHVTPFIYEHSDLFNIQKLQIPEMLKRNQWLRLTIDTYDDFVMAQTIFEKNQDCENIANIIQTAENSGYKGKMQKIIEQQSK